MGNLRLSRRLARRVLTHLPPDASSPCVRAGQGLRPRPACFVRVCACGPLPLCHTSTPQPLPAGLSQCPDAPPPARPPADRQRQTRPGLQARPKLMSLLLPRQGAGRRATRARARARVLPPPSPPAVQARAVVMCAHARAACTWGRGGGPREQRRAGLLFNVPRGAAAEGSPRACAAAAQRQPPAPARGEPAIYTLPPTAQRLRRSQR